MVHQIRPHPGWSGRLEPSSRVVVVSRVIGDLRDGSHASTQSAKEIILSLRLLFVIKLHSASTTEVGSAEAFKFPSVCFLSQQKKSQSQNNPKKKREIWPVFFFKATNNKDYISKLYLLDPSGWWVDLLSVIYLLPYWPISGSGCARLQISEWLLSTNFSLWACEENDSESCVEQLINSVFMPR